MKIAASPKKSPSSQSSADGERCSSIRIAVKKSPGLWHYLNKIRPVEANPKKKLVVKTELPKFATKDSAEAGPRKGRNRQGLAPPSSAE